MRTTYPTDLTDAEWNYIADRRFNPATHGCRWLDGPGGGYAVPSGPCLCVSCFRGGSPRPRFCVIVTPPISRTHNEQVCPVAKFRSLSVPFRSFFRFEHLR